MGIIEEELAVVELDNGQKVQIEKNIGSGIHVHIGNIRIELSENEFQEFSKAISDGKENLINIKDGIQ